MIRKFGIVAISALLLVGPSMAETVHGERTGDGTDVLDLGGTEATNYMIGSGLQTPITGMTDNIMIGDNILGGTHLNMDNNVLIGVDVLTGATGAFNDPTNAVVIGDAACSACLDADNSVIIGADAVQNQNTDEESNNLVAIGYGVASNVGAGSLQGSVFIGANAMLNMTGALTNTVAIGGSVGATGTNGINAVILGSNAIPGDCDGCVVIGEDGGRGASGNDSIYIGKDAGQAPASVTGIQNVIVGNTGDMDLVTDTSGAGVGYGVDLGDHGSALGHSAVAGDNAVALGADASAADGELVIRANGVNVVTFDATNQITLLDGAGSTWLDVDTSGTEHTIGIGAGVLASRIAGMDGNIAIGEAALDAAATAGMSNNIAIGVNAIGAANSATTGNVVAIGNGAFSDAGLACSGCIAIGQSAGLSATSSTASIWIGTQAGFLTTIGDQNVVVGHQAADGGNIDDAVVIGALAGSTGNVTNSVIVGTEACSTALCGSHSIIIGKSAGGAGAGSQSIGIGSDALDLTTSGGLGNIAVGYTAGNLISTGDYNTILGDNADVLANTGSKGVAVGANTVVGDNAVALGADASAASNELAVNYGGSEQISGTTTDVTVVPPLQWKVSQETVAVAGPNVLTAAESGKRFADTGAVVQVGHTLPAVAAGLFYIFEVETASGVRLTAQAGETITYRGNTTAGGGYVEWHVDSLWGGKAVKVLKANTGGSAWDLHTISGPAVVTDGTWTDGSSPSAVFKGYSLMTGSSGTYWAAGFYDAPAADANLTQAATTQTYGSAAESTAAHAFVVLSGAGSAASGTVELRVTGTTINDSGTRATSQSETLLADITAGSANLYLETTAKWLGQVTFELNITSGAPATYSLDFNYGFAKYEDFGNRDMVVSDFEMVGRAGATDANIGVTLYHHSSTGWTYSAAAFSPGGTVIADLDTDHSTDDTITNGKQFAYKRANLTTVIDGSALEGVIVKVTTSANNAISYSDIHIGGSF